MLILKCGISPGYVLDDMPLYIAQLLLDNLYMVDQGAMERMRMMCWASVAPHSKKQLKPTDMFKFSWEEREKAESAASISKERMAALQQQAQEIRKKLIQDNG